MKNNLKILSLILLVSFVFSCKKEVEVEPDPPVTPEVIVFETTKVMDVDTRANITTIDTSNYTFTLVGESNLSNNLKVGDIIVDSVSEKAPNGYLRRITSISGKKGNLSLNTEQALLSDAIQQAHIVFNSGQIKTSQIKKVKLADGVTFNTGKNPDFTVFELDYDETVDNEYGSLNIQGHTELSMEFYFDYNFSYEFPFTINRSFKSGVTLDQAASFSMVCEGGASIDEERIDLATFYFDAWTFMVGPVPVVIFPRVQVFVEVDGQITAVFTTSASESFHGQLGVDYKSDRNPTWKKVANKEFLTDYVAPNLNMNAYARADLGPELAFLLYGVIGPYVDATAFGEVTGDLQAPSGNWNLDFVIGVRSRVGVKAEILGFDVNYPFELYRDTLMHLQNEVFGNAIFIQNPISGNSYPIDENIMITTSYSGEIPDQVIFVIDNVVEFTDDTEPFEYDWNTENMTEGQHAIRVEEIIDNETVSHDTTHINFYEVHWSENDLSDFGASDQTTCTDMYFNDGNLGWITLAGAGYGKILQTNDGGVTWQENSNTNFPMKKMKMFGAQHGIYITYFNGVKYTSDGGHTIGTLEYSTIPGVWQPTFQWKDIFDITTTMNDKIVAIGKDTGIPYHFHVYRADIDDHVPFDDFQIPFPNETGMPPSIETYGNKGIVYGIIDEDNTSTAYYMTSSNTCDTWQTSQFTQITNSNTYLRDACYYNEDKLWIVGSEDNSALVMISSDGGSSWDKVTVAGASSFGTVTFVSADVGYATLFDYTTVTKSRLFKTLDGGYTWNPVTEVTSQHSMSRVFFKGPNQGMVVGKGDKAYRYHL